ncbi:MAG: hypothetical protein AAF850_11925 [Pseudomonadota bacterium]
MRIVVGFFAILGLIFVLIVGALFVVGRNAVRDMQPLIAEAPQYAEESARAFAENWDANAILERASPELQAEIAKNFAAFSGFASTLPSVAGKFVSLRTPVCENYNVNYDQNRQRVFTSACTATGISQKAVLSFQINVLHRNDKWALLGFFVTATQTGIDNNRPSVDISLPAGAGARAFSESGLSSSSRVLAHQRPSVVLDRDYLTFNAKGSQEIITGAAILIRYEMNGDEAGL